MTALKPFKTINVEIDPLFKDFCMDRNLAPSSIRLYRFALNKYTNFLGKTLTQLIDEAEQEENDQLRMKKRKVTKYLREFKQQMEKQKLSYNYINHNLALIRAFYTEYDIMLPIKRRKARRDRKIETFESLPTNAELKTIMNYANNTYKALITTMLSSGMGGAEVLSLKFKHFYDALELDDYPKRMDDLIKIVGNTEHKILLWRIHRVKTGKSFFTFTSSEAHEMIINYLYELYRTHLDFNPSPDDQLFRNNNIPIKPQALRSMFRRMNDKAGLRRINGIILIRPHRLRKLFGTTLEKNKIQHTSTRFMMGHSIDKTTEAYFLADPDSLREDYIQISDQLTINRNPLNAIDNYDNLINELDTLKKKISSFRRSNSPY